MSHTAESPGGKPFQVLQRRFAGHLRDPRMYPAPEGIEPRRLRVYAELFYNNVEGFLANGFPVLRGLTPDDRWHAMVRDYFARHASHEPQFRGIAAEFLRYLEDERGPQPDDPPFLRELAHYEWVELALAVAPDPPPLHVDADGDLLDGVPVLSPLAWPLAYAFPVHRISADFQPQTPGEQPTYLVVYRDAADDVKFMEINTVTARLLELLESQPASGRALLQRVAAELNHPDPNTVIAAGHDMLHGLRQRGIVRGTRL
jgi:uncharacterized protein